MPNVLEPPPAQSFSVTEVGHIAAYMYFMEKGRLPHGIRFRLEEGYSNIPAMMMTKLANAYAANYLAATGVVRQISGE